MHSFGRGHHNDVGLLRFSVCAGALLVAAGVSADDSSQRRLVTIALEGQRAPGTDGGTFDPIPQATPANPFPTTGFDEPMINERGNVAFAATFKKNGNPGTGIFFSRNGDLRSVLVTGQMTPVGTFTGTNIGILDGPAVNDNGVIAFVAFGFNDNGNSGALFKSRNAFPPLVVVERTGDPSPDGRGPFTAFDDFAQNERGDLAFIADFGTNQTGVFFKRDGFAAEAIVRSGGTLSGTGGSLCTGLGGDVIDGPWVNDLGDVAFQADCITGGAAFEGSIFLKRHNQSGLVPFVLIGDRAPGGGAISEIHIGRSGMNDHSLVLQLAVNGGDPQIIATKGLVSRTFSVCAQNGDPVSVPFDGDLAVGNSAPTISTNGTIAFGGTVVDDTGTVLADTIFTCRNGLLSTVAFQGGPRPGGGTFGSVEESSNADGHVVFLDEGGGSNPRTGVFASHP